MKGKNMAMLAMVGRMDEAIRHDVVLSISAERVRGIYLDAVRFVSPTVLQLDYRIELRSICSHEFENLLSSLKGRKVKMLRAKVEMSFSDEERPFQVLVLMKMSFWIDMADVGKSEE